jgi:hypothetical protein
VTGGRERLVELARAKPMAGFAAPELLANTPLARSGGSWRWGDARLHQVARSTR